MVQVGIPMLLGVGSATVNIHGLYGRVPSQTTLPAKRSGVRELEVLAGNV